MTEPDNLVLVYLRRIDEKVDAMGGELRDVKDRLSAVEFALAGIRREMANLAETDARLQAGMDRMRDDIARIKNRLDLQDAPPAH